MDLNFVRQPGEICSSVKLCSKTWSLKRRRKNKVVSYLITNRKSIIRIFDPNIRKFSLHSSFEIDRFVITVIYLFKVKCTSFSSLSLLSSYKSLSFRLSIIFRLWLFTSTPWFGPIRAPRDPFLTIHLIFSLDLITWKISTTVLPICIISFQVCLLCNEYNNNYHKSQPKLISIIKRCFVLKESNCSVWRNDICFIFD